MARDPYLIVNRYAAKMRGRHLGDAFSGQHTTMVTNYATYIGEMCAVIEATKQLLNAQGVAISQYPFYLVYSREIFRLTKSFGGLTLLRNRDVVQKKWKDWGLDERLLKSIDRDIFGLPETPRP
ncbi:MAG: hypothetical protein RMJ34_07590 [candidate division WOR-3 bacterium]|nr:hypothetical protein [candidate division WOR-3 bacterium]MDW8114775.1 hypothetical protein [candidate division WOR-3 bacterium]